MKLEPLNLSHQQVLENKFMQLNLSLSEYSFANLYLFRDLHRYELLTLEKEIFIKGLARDQCSFIMMTNHPTQIPSSLIKTASNFAQFLFPIPEEWLIYLKKMTLQTEFKEAESDYVYATSKLATYSGRHLDSKRNQVNQLLNQHKVRTESIIEQFEDMQQILNNWQEASAINSTETDYLSCQAAIKNFRSLHLQGKIVYIDDHPAGFIIGEELSKDYYVAHFCKASRSIKGLYQYLYQELAKSLEGQFSWINLEPDLGISALQQSKNSYQPDLLIKKWRVQVS